jgi:hypothetical protein
LIERFRWVVFLDGDEFLTLRNHPRLPEFLAEFEEFGAVVLQWHVFGHNGYYEDPPGLITSALTRRMREPSPRVKSITKVAALAGIDLAHVCDLKPGYFHVDANKRACTFLPDRTGSPLYPGKSDVAHVNHYMCRSFLTWMKRAQRGDVVFDRQRAPKEHQWRFTEEDCLRQFVRTVAKDKNEFIDDFMCRYARDLTRYLEGLHYGVEPAACINKG